MQKHVAMTVGIPWSNLGPVTVASLVRLLMGLPNKLPETTLPITGTHKELSEGLTDNGISI
jgi:hypothetical protein